MTEPMPLSIKLFIIAFVTVVAIAILVVITPFSIIDATERGVVTRWGNPVRVLEPGIHFVTPIVENVHRIDVTTQKEAVQAGAASKDLQSVSATVAINYQVDPTRVTDMWVNFRGDYRDRVIAPAIQEAVKAATAKYTAEELITKRELVKADITTALQLRLSQVYITVSNVAIENFDFSKQFNVAIEEKVRAEQEALKAKNDLERVKFEAEQRVATAEAEAQAIRLSSDAANNPRYVDLKKLEVQLEFAKKWNGILPQNIYAGAPIPFLQIEQ